MNSLMSFITHVLLLVMNRHENHAGIGGSIITDRKSFCYVPLILSSHLVMESSWKPYQIGVGLVESEGLSGMIFAMRRYISGIVELRLKCHTYNMGLPTEFFVCGLSNRKSRNAYTVRVSKSVEVNTKVWVITVGYGWNIMDFINCVIKLTIDLSRTYIHP